MSNVSMNMGCGRLSSGPMSSKFIRDESGAIRIVFTSQEAHVLINLTEQLIELLGDGGLNAGVEVDPLLQMMGFGGSEQPPEDPVLRRLLPNAYKDEKSASEFRRYTEHGMREKKCAHAMQIYESLTTTDDDWDGDQPIDRGSVEVTFQESDGMAWLGGLNDLRLALAVRLGVSREFGDVDKTDKAGGESGESGAGGAGGAGGASHTRSERLSSEEINKKYELMSESEPMKAVYAVYSWLGWLQQSLLELLMSGGDDHQAT